MKRSEIKLSDFGLPSKKKYPMPDEKHVKSAIRFFNYVDPEDEKELADNIKKKMKKYGISPQSVGDTNRLKKYISESFQEPSGIDTIIFDFGAVLVHCLDSEKALEEAGIPKEYISEILSTMMSSYKKVDSEQFTITETIEFFTRALRQELKTYAAAAWYAYQSANAKYPYTVDLLKILKSNGYKIYYLSNWDKAGHEQCVRNGLFDFIDIFDGGIFSYQVGLVKPDKRIYELLLKRYSIDPSKAIFFDDRGENIASAKELGIHGIVFTPDIGYDLLESQKKKSNNTAVEEGSIVTEEAALQEGYLSQATMTYRIHPRKTLEQILKTHKYEGLFNMAVKCKKEEDVRYLLRDYRTGKAYFMKIMERIEKCNKLGDCKETHNYYKGVKKKFIDNGITVKDVQLTIKWYDDVYCPALKSRLKELKEKNAHIHEFVQSILEEPMVGSSKVFIVNNMMHNTFIGCGYGDDTSIQYFKPAKDIDLSTNDINELIRDGVAQVYEYVGPRSYMDMCISESANYTTVDRDYFKRVYIEICSEADAIYEIEKHSMLGEINTRIKKDPIAMLAEATVYPTPRDTNLLVISEEFKNSPLLEIHRDTDGYYIKNAITNKRSKSREESSVVPYNVAKCLINNHL